MAASTVVDTRAFSHEKSSLLESDQPVKRRGPSINIYSTSKNSEICLPSPSIVAAQAFYIQQKACKAPITPPEPESTTRKAQEVWQIQSAVPSSPDIASTLEQFKISARSTPEALEKDNATSLVLPRRQSVATAADVPFLYIHNHLRTWGQTYLSNTTSADAFVNPIMSRRLSMVMIPEATSPGSPTTTTIRARVLPIDKSRKPFLLRRQFDLADLRATIPLPSETKTLGVAPVRPRRSGRNRRASTQVLSAKTSSKDRDSLKTPLSRLGLGSTPIRKFIPILSKNIH
jgi:hypothetical protein